MKMFLSHFSDSSHVQPKTTKNIHTTKSSMSFDLNLPNSVNKIIAPSFEFENVVLYLKTKR